MPHPLVPFVPSILMIPRKKRSTHRSAALLCSPCLIFSPANYLNTIEDEKAIIKKKNAALLVLWDEMRQREGENVVIKSLALLIISRQLNMNYCSFKSSSPFHLLLLFLSCYSCLYVVHYTRMTAWRLLTDWLSPPFIHFTPYHHHDVSLKKRETQFLWKFLLRFRVIED